ncbi:P-loop NTPase [bacterium]|nr:P-loop NTPase [bacterium]
MMASNGKHEGHDSDSRSEGANGPEMTAEIKDREYIREQLSVIKHKVLVLSGKGGVGKSTVAVNLAAFLAGQGMKVGLLDIDIHGPSVPELLGLKSATVEGRDGKLLPVMSGQNLKVMSIGFLIRNPDEAVIWRGPMKYGVIKQFLKDVIWGELDYMIVDSPPGTGDEPLSVAQLIDNPDGAVIVTTPQALSLSDVRRCIGFCRKLHVPVLGVVENMSGFVCPNCGEKVDIFKSGGGMKMASDMSVPFLGSIPIDPAIVVASDAGTPFAEGSASSDAADAFQKIAASVLSRTGGETAQTAVESSTKTSEIESDEEMPVTKIETKKIAVPVIEGKLSQHFGHPEYFAIFDVDTSTGKALSSQKIDSPPHQPGLLPGWLHERGVQVIIAGGMGSRAKDLFSERGVEVVLGVGTDDPSALVEAYLAGTLTSGDNLCDH